MSSYKIKLQGTATWDLKCICNNSIFAHLRQKRIIRKLKAGRQIGCISMCPQGKTIVSGDYDGAYLSDVATGNKRKLNYQIEKSVVAIAYSQDGRFIAIGYTDRKITVNCANITIYDSQLTKALSTFELGRNEEIYLKFSFDGKYLAASLSDNYVFIWGINGQYISKLQLRGYSKECAYLAWFHRDFHLTTLNSKGLKIWNIQKLKSIKIRKATADSLCYSNKGNHVFIGYRDIRVLDVKTHITVIDLRVYGIVSQFIYCARQMIDIQQQSEAITSQVLLEIPFIIVIDQRLQPGSVSLYYINMKISVLTQINKHQIYLKFFQKHMKGLLYMIYIDKLKEMYLTEWLIFWQQCN